LKIILICATTLDGYIARHSNEITNWTKDLKLFKKQTTGYPVIMGSNTFKTLQNELTGRNVIVFHRNDNPYTIIKELKTTYKKIFIAGGGKTNERFMEYITDMYITPHPVMFGTGIKLFGNNKLKIKTRLTKSIEIHESEGLLQYQFKIV
jgi:dihydrofolate reductase|tara:strand:- start:172 stop:621 length:450 start_codon:yes stop_codon:yes gene_type:complete